MKYIKSEELKYLLRCEEYLDLIPPIAFRAIFDAIKMCEVEIDSEVNDNGNI